MTSTQWKLQLTLKECDRLRAENEKLHGDLFALRVEVERLLDFMNWSAAADAGVRREPALRLLRRLPP